MGIDTFLLSQSPYGPVEILDGGVFQDEFLDAGPDESENLLLDPGGPDPFCASTLPPRLWFPPFPRQKMPRVLIR